MTGPGDDSPDDGLPASGRGDSSASGENGAPTGDREDPRTTDEDEPPAFPEQPPDAELLLLLANETNRRLVADYLGQRFEVTGDPGRIVELDDELDCCLVDLQSFYRHRDRLLAARREARPRFLPIVLVRSEATDLEPGVWGRVDDVVVPPIGRRELLGRVRTLLRARSLSVSLARQNERLDQLADVVAHDLRNPLTGAISVLDVVRDTGDPEHVDRVESSLERVEAIVEDLLAFARHGGVVTETEPLSVERVADAAWSVVDPADAATLEVATGARIRADGDRLQTALENLLDNAVTHAGPDVTVRVTREDGQLVVEDDGPGIPPARREAVFECGGGSAGSTGLGLAIVEGVVEAHGWDVEVAESPAGGARFEIAGVAFLDQ